MSLKENINNDLKASMKSGDTISRGVLRLLFSDIRNKEIDLRKELADEDVLAIIKSNVKKRTDAIELYKKGNRNDLVAQEEGELNILRKYMPKQMDEEKIGRIVKEVIQELGISDPSKFGMAMKEVMKKTGPNADGKMVSGIVKEELEKQVL